MRFESKSVIVTGAASGIGRAIAERFAAEGANVTIADVDAENGQRVAESIRSRGARAEFVNADVADGDQVRALVASTVERWAAIDVLVANAGICPFEELFEIGEASWRRVVDVNLTGAFLCAKEAAGVMVERGTKGKIVAVGSLSGIFASTQQAHYSASKAGVNLLVRSLAVSLAPHGITCNAVLPGAVETELNRSVMEDPATRRQWERRAPLGRLGTPDDIAGPVLFLASDDAAWCSGSLLVVDGATSATL